MERQRNRTQFRSLMGLPVSCEVYVELNSAGVPEISHSIEVEGSSGFKMMSQTCSDETEVLTIYRNWRRDPNNRSKILRI